MKLLSSAVLALPIVMAFSSGSFAQTSTPSAGVQTTVAISEPVDKQSYLETQKSRMAKWRQNIAEFDDRVETKTTQVGQAARLEIASAWTSVEHASANLGAAGGDDWTAAKATYERAVDSLEATWAKYYPKKN